MASDDLTAAAEPEDCCVGEMAMNGDPNGMHAFDCPAYERQSEALAKLMDTRRTKAQLPAPVPPVDREALIEAVAANHLRRYESQYQADHLTWRNFADDAAEDVDALLARGLRLPTELDGATLIAAERRRQVEAERMTAQHDDAYREHQLVRAAMCYAFPRGLRPMEPRLAAGAGDDRGDRYVRTPVGWPWHPDDFKPSDDDRVRELSKAGALIAAEIDRLKRADLPTLTAEQNEEGDGHVARG
ncbi:MAG TPA: hypothetical protein VHX38_02010 [Pseudonocardiaceae bacterium]|jgi:hypothetical protein|nr:hypothetical protein [Pseudonocardiaceae bacterium]